MCSDIEFIEIVKNSKSMAEAAATLRMHFNSFKTRATELKCYSPSLGRRKAIYLDAILEGLHPQYQTYQLKLKLFDCGLKENVCEKCGVHDWCGETLRCELDHIDGDRTNHSFENLRILCPNCHSQTDTYRGKKR
jgi:hypothetical protein